MEWAGTAIGAVMGTPAVVEAGGVRVPVGHRRGDHRHGTWQPRAMERVSPRRFDTEAAIQAAGDRTDRTYDPRQRFTSSGSAWGHTAIPHLPWCWPPDPEAGSGNAWNCGWVQGIGIEAELTLAVWQT